MLSYIVIMTKMFRKDKISRLRDYVSDWTLDSDLFPGPP